MAAAEHKGVASFDTRSDVREADLSPDVRSLIANVHAQIHDILTRYEVTSIEALMAKLGTVGRGAKLGARHDVAQLQALTDRLHTLWKEHDMLAEAYAFRTEAKELARKAVHDVAVDRTDGPREIIDFASQVPPFDLRLLTPALEVYLLYENVSQYVEVFERIAQSVDVAAVEDSSTLLNKERLAEKLFRLLGRHGKSDDARELLKKFFPEMRPHRFVQYAVGVAESGDAEEAANIFSEAVSMVNTFAVFAERDYARLGVCAGTAGIDGTLAFDKALQRIRELLREGRDAANSSDDLAVAYGKLGDEAGILRIDAMGEGVQTGSGWDALAAYYAAQGDLAAAERCAEKAGEMQADGRLAIAKAMIDARDQARFAPMAKNWDFAMSLLAGKHALQLDADAFAWVRDQLPYRESWIDKKWIEMLCSEGRYREVCDAVEQSGGFRHTYYYAVARYACGEKDDAIRTMGKDFRNHGEWLQFAETVREAGDDPAPYVLRATRARADSISDGDWAKALLTYDFIHEARTFADTVTQTQRDTEEVGLLWAHIGQWYAERALARAKAAAPVLKKIEAPV